jgi:hypothetical protein
MEGELHLLIVVEPLLADGRRRGAVPRFGHELAVRNGREELPVDQRQLSRHLERVKVEERGRLQLAWDERLRRVLPHRPSPHHPILLQLRFGL